MREDSPSAMHIDTLTKTPTLELNKNKELITFKLSTFSMSDDDDYSGFSCSFTSVDTVAKPTANGAVKPTKLADTTTTTTAIEQSSISNLCDDIVNSSHDDSNDVITCWVHRTGVPMRLRKVRKNDKSLILEAFSRLSADSIMKRFFTLKSALSEAELRSFTEPNETEYCIVITIPDTLLPQGERIVGIGQFFTLLTKPTEAEVAFLVIDEFQHQGLATKLLKHLLQTAYGRGIRTFLADTFLTNFGMQALVTHNVAGVKLIRDGTEVTLVIPVNADCASSQDLTPLSPLLTRSKQSAGKEDPRLFRRPSYTPSPLS